MQGLTFLLRLKSFHPHYLNRYAFIILTKLKKQNFNLKHQVFLPKQVERFTVLRSPHVDKKARDQFERRIHQRILY